MRQKALNDIRQKFTPAEIRALIETLQPKENIRADVLSPENLKRMALTASLIPKSARRGARLIDIGGSVYWLPIYTQLLGYDHIIILGRSGGAFLEGFQIPGRGENFALEDIEADAELDPYPIQSGTVDCATCFHLLEHLAGDPMHMVAEANRILRADGYLCLTTPNVLYHYNVAKFLFGDHPFGWSVYTDSYADRHNREYTPMEIQRLLEAGGFSLDVLQTHTWNPEHDLKKTLTGFALCLIPSLARRVSLKLRGSEILARARKTSGVLERFPSFLYDLFGAMRVSVKLGQLTRPNGDRASADDSDGGPGSSVSGPPSRSAVIGPSSPVRDLQSAVTGPRSSVMNHE